MEKYILILKECVKQDAKVLFSGKAGNGMEMLNKYKKEMITGVGLALLLFLFLKYVFPLLSPFLLSYLSVYAVYPLLYKLEKKWKIKKTVTMFFLLGIFVVLLLGAVWIFLLATGGSVEEFLPVILEWKDRLFVTSGSAFFQDMLPDLLKNTVAYVGKVFPILAYIGIYLIATILMAKDFDGLMERVHGVGALDMFMDVVGKILRTAGLYLKAQLILILVIMVICTTGFYFIGISSPILLGVLTGVMDALPFIGTGIVLIPSSILFFLEGEILKGVVCLMLYIVCVAVRELLEPRLVGKGLGIFPVILLISIYAGMKLFGVSGIIKGPLAVVLYKNIWTMLFKLKEKNAEAVGME